MGFYFLNLFEPMLSRNKDAFGKDPVPYILHLLSPMLSENKHAFGKDLVPPLLLTLDRVLGGRPLSSATPLFRLPSEILGIIIQYLAPDSLASLALLSRDCRQWARSRQLASIKFDYSESTLGLIQLLLDEQGRNGASASRLTSLQILGPCIRRITVATNPGWITHRHGIELNDEFMAMERNVSNKLMKEATQNFYDTYVSCLEKLLGNREVLPNLELLNWEDRIMLPRSFFNALSATSIRHLKLSGVTVEEEFEIEQTSAHAARGWPLQSLHLDVHPPIYGTDEISTARLCTSILSLCAPTLESLTWSSVMEKTPHFFANTASSPPHFACLRYLTLQQINFVEITALEALLQDKLYALDVDTESTLCSTEFFEKRGTVKSLRIFVWSSYKLPSTHSLAFVRANPQLTKLDLKFPNSGAFLEERLLLLLFTSFPSLTSLGLTWKETSIPESALQKISTLKGLQQIRLSAGKQDGWIYNWLIDHELMRKYLGCLPCLAKIAFSRDTYTNVRSTDSARGRYYKDLLPENEDDIPFADWHNPEIWEQYHRKRMLVEANRYVLELPLLKWLFIGQVPISVGNTRANGEREAVALSEERVDCYTLLKEMFGWKPSEVKLSFRG